MEKQGNMLEKLGRYARKSNKNICSKKHFIKQKGARKSNKEKGVWIVAKKLHPHPLNLKSKVSNQGEED